MSNAVRVETFAFESRLNRKSGLAIVVIAGLNFLGVGVNPPTPTWGSMIYDGAGVINQGQWWVALFPSLAILVVISCVNLTARVVEDLTQAR